MTGMDERKIAPASIPSQVRSLFWDTDPEALDPGRHPEYVLERVLERGTPEAVRWARDLFGDDRIREFLRADGPRRLSARTLNYWALRLDVRERECLVTSCRGNNPPLWRP